jgi:exodeoxyribonuclease VII large subunit
LLTSYLRDVVESDELLQDVWIEGELSSYTVAASGHAYFTLRDDRTVLDGVMWKPMRLRQMYTPAVGDQAVVHGSITLYERASRYQVKADVVQPAGAGILQLQFEQLRQRLEAEGLFEPDRKRPLPLFPERIGVVTSPVGAVWHDIRQVIGRRYPLVELLLAPATVQGTGATASILSALETLNATEGLDLVVVARGGGSAEDLSTFNDERIVRAIFASRLPVVSAIGHETDITLADLVADLRAPTPSAAAEVIVPDVRELRALVVDLRRRQHAAVSSLTSDRRMVVRSLRQRLDRSSPHSALRGWRAEVVEIRSRLSRAAAWQVAGQKHAVELAQARLEALSPAAQFSRGWAFVTHDGGGTPVRSIAALGHGDRLTAALADGAVTARVIETRAGQPEPATLRDDHG